MREHVLRRMRKITFEEAWGPLWNKGYRNNWECNFKMSHGSDILVGRAVTAVMGPFRPDLDKALMDIGQRQEGHKGFYNQWVIDSLVEDDVVVVNDTQRWNIGIKKRTKGSVHKDWIECMAADLAECNMIAVFPVSGWWYNRMSLDKVEAEMRYSLIVSLETEEQQVNFSTEIETKIPIAQQIEVGY